jgi:RNA polymerase sigma-70 factor (ECF subfamily)
MEVNGKPAVVSWRNGKPFSVLTLEASEGYVTAIYVITNPEKLSHIPGLH